MLYSDVGKVPSDSGIFRSTGELRELTGGSYGPYWAIREREEQAAGAAAPLPLLVRIGQGFGGGATPLFPSPSSPLPFPLGGLLLGVGFLVGVPYLVRHP